MALKPKPVEADAARDNAEGEGEPAPAKSGLLGKFSRKTIIIAVAAVAVVGGGAGGYFFFFGHHKEKAEQAEAPKPSVFVDMPDVLVNLANTGDRTQYLKVKITLEVADQNLVKQITPVMPRVMDAFQTYLRELRPTDLEGSAGLYRLKEELTRRVNVAVAPSRVTAVLFKEIIVQ
jgi:flagellar FliL protein